MHSLANKEIDHRVYTVACCVLSLQVVELLSARREMVSGADSRVDWAMAEALAVGTLLLHR
jgi:2-oxoglutarate dehydrogenase complex dehydrogenase (E1) component-like enzyme